MSIQDVLNTIKDEEVAYVDQDEVASIEGFDEDTAEEKVDG